MLPTIIAQIIALVFPGAPAWVAAFVGGVIPVVFEVVEELDDIRDLTGADKFEAAARLVGEALDEAFDTIPEWSELDEDRRDSIVAGLVEFAVFVSDLTEKNGKAPTRRAVRGAVRALRKG